MCVCVFLFAFALFLAQIYSTDVKRLESKEKNQFNLLNGQQYETIPQQHGDEGAERNSCNTHIHCINYTTFESAARSSADTHENWIIPDIKAKHFIVVFGFPFARIQYNKYPLHGTITWKTSSIAFKISIRIQIHAYA